MPSTLRDSLVFETPENVQVQYRAAGLGTRFIAWFVDQVFVLLVMILGLILLVVTAISMESVMDDLVDVDALTPEQVEKYIGGVFIVIYGLGSFVYFTLSELVLRGQTIGKRMTRIRVVKVDGFALDGASILLRNIFRIVDNIPLMWIVPFISTRSQRTGDMVSGTVVISDEAPNLSEIRVQLSSRSALDAEFRFDASGLQRLGEQDFEAIEQLLDRWQAIPAAQRTQLAGRLVTAVVNKLRVAPPPEDKQGKFLEDLLAAELRRQARSLG